MSSPLDHLDMTSLERSDFLPRIDTDCGKFSPLSSPTDCPSLSGSFFSNTTVVEGDSTRRGSVASSQAPYSPDWYSAKSSIATSPTTPAMGFHGGGMKEVNRLKSEQELHHPSMYNLAPYELSDANIWGEDSPPHDSLMHLISASSSMQLMNVLGLPSQPSFCHGYNLYSQTMSTSDPSLSRRIFGVEDAFHAAHGSMEERLPWSEHVTSPPQTIAPAAAFQPILTSSPLTKNEPSTPCKRDIFSTAMLSSSPMALLSPPIVPSQHDFGGHQYEMADHTILSPDCSGDGSSVASEYWASLAPDRPRLHRRAYERKRHVGPSFKPRRATNKSGINCDAIIAQNEFACGYANCLDKRGYAKRFKRQEHKKRHEKTVHEKEGSYKCWVPGCTTNAFTRNDNLKSHLKNTHGKKSANQRNRYVATQDSHSEFYDPLWTGNLTEAGYPKRS